MIFHYTGLTWPALLFITKNYTAQAGKGQRYLLILLYDFTGGRVVAAQFIY